MLKKRKGKYYTVVAQDTKYLQGVFPYTPEGKEQAEAYADRLTEAKKNRFLIVPR